MTILLIELETKGHHLSSYLRSIVTELVKNKKKIIFLTTKEIKKNNFYSFFNKYTKIIYINKIKYPLKKNYFSFLKFQITNYKIIKEKFQQIKKKNNIDHIYVNTLDFLDKPLSIFGSPFGDTKFSGLYLNPKFYIQYKSLLNNLVKNKLYIFLFEKLLQINSLSNIFIVDPLCSQFLNKRAKINYQKIKFINELGSSNKIEKFNLSILKCRKILKISKNDFVILIYGFIRKNKSLDELFKVVQYIKTKKPIKILIVGKRDIETQLFLKNTYKKNKKLASMIIDINKFSDDLFEKIVFKASNLTWAGYSKNFYGSSGVYFLSSTNHVPVISSDHGAIGWYSKKYNIGASVDLTNKTKLIKVLNRLMKFNRKIKYDFTKVNSIYNFKNFGFNICKNLK